MEKEEKKKALTNEKKGNEETVVYELDHNKSDILRESLPAYGLSEKKQGEFTIEDYRNWPQDERVELLDGEIIRMDSPNFNHQSALQNVVLQFSNYIAAKHGTCRALFSPLDLQLDEDEKTMLQPDFIVLCDERKIRSWGIFGAPDFVLEILSPGSRAYDMGRKKNKYIAAGVKEYWILDLEKEMLITYAEANGYVSAIYPLQGSVGVAIYESDLEIDLDSIRVNLFRQ